MLILISNIKITQVPTKSFPTRSKSYAFNFVRDIEISSGWEDFTNTSKLVFPKNIYFVDETGKKTTWQGQNVTGSLDSPPILLRGDKITIELGYTYDLPSKPGEQIQQATKINSQFTGYITKINPAMPVEIECEDYMYLCKQVQVPSKTYTGTIQDMLKDMFSYASASSTAFADANLTLNATTTVSVGQFITENETIAQVLNRLQKDYQLESSFVGTELRCNMIVYFPNEAVQNVFAFQENIIDDDLEFKRLDDYRLAIKAYSVMEVAKTGTRKDGKPRKGKSRISVFITKDNKGNVIETPESGWDGESRTLYFYATDKNTLKTLAGEKMNRLYYEGVFGDFTTFGLPFVKVGDEVILRDNILPERNGIYKVKKVKTTFGLGGFRVNIELDERVDTAPSEDSLS